MRDKRPSIFYRHVYGFTPEPSWEAVQRFSVQRPAGFFFLATGSGVVSGFCSGELACVCAAAGVTPSCAASLSFTAAMVALHLFRSFR